MPEPSATEERPSGDETSDREEAEREFWDETPAPPRRFYANLAGL